MQALPSKDVNALLERPWTKKYKDQLLGRGLQTQKFWIYYKSWIEGKKSQTALQDLIYDQSFFKKIQTYFYFLYLFSAPLKIIFEGDNL